VLIAVWLAVNPFVFGKPRHHRAWSTRAMLGEELWISRRPRDAAMAVSAVTSAASLTAVIAACRHRLVPAAIATGVQMTFTLVYWEQMVRYFERQKQPLDTDPQYRGDMPDEPATPNATPPDPGYDSAGVPTFEFVREKIETRYGTSLGAAELDAESSEGQSVEKQYEERQRAAAERLAQIRESMHSEDS
jgi:hypothetical protein